MKYQRVNELCERRRVAKRSSGGLLLGTGLLTALTCIPASQTLAAPQEPDVVYLTGTVRDFHEAHPDFHVIPAEGLGHIAMNVGLRLGPDKSPQLSGNGFMVGSQWRDSGFRPIPTHLSSAGGPGVWVTTGPLLENHPVVDTFDSGQGPYNPLTAGPAPSFITGATMPTIDDPTGLPPSVDQLIYDVNHGTTVVSSNIHCNKFLVSNHHTIQISGDVTILCEEEFKFQNHARLELLADATLTLYTNKVATLQDQIQANMNTADPSRFVIYHRSTEPFLLQNQVGLYATLISPTSLLRVQDGSHFYGRFTGESVHVKNHAGLHLDGPVVQAMCGTMLADSAGSASASTTGGITSNFTFGGWYNDVLGTNLSTAHTIGLLRDGAGVYEFLSDAFYPIDGRLFGNEGEDHNNYFTFAITARFTFEQCAGQFIEFEGSDDAWVFIDDDLGIDLGGLTPRVTQRLDIDRIAGLTDGEEYQMRFFFANRDPNESVFRVRTNISLSSDEVPTASPVSD